MDWIGSEKVSGGWIKLYRQLQDCWIWKGSAPFDKRSAWVDLLLLPMHNDKKMLIDNEIVVIKRGSFMTSIVKLSARWAWSRGKVLRYLKLLESEQMLNTKRTPKGTLITIVKYDVFQGMENTDSTTVDTTVGTTLGTTNDTTDGTADSTTVGTADGTQNKNIKNNKNNKELKNVKNEEEYIPPISPLKGKTKKFIPPTVEEVQDYCIERNNGIDAQAFVDFYESKGWVVGKAKMKDWKAAVRTWENKRKNDNSYNSQQKNVNASRQSQLDYLLESIRRDEGK